MEPEQLPPPASGLFLEVSFRRLLASCEGIVHGVVSGVDDATTVVAAAPSMLAVRPELARDWATSPVFHHYVETLQEQLADLEGAAPAKRPSAQVLAAYKRRADALSARLRPPAAPPSYLLALAGREEGGGAAAAAAAASTRAAAANDGGSGGNDGTGGGGSDDDETRNEARRAELLGPGASSSSSSPPSSFGPAVPPAMRPAGPPPASLRGLAPRTAEEVSTQRALQETLAADLAGLARRLRTNAEAAGAAVAERERLLRAAEGALDGAVDGAKRSVAEVKAVYFVNRRGFWATMMTFLTVGAVFTVTFVYIRATSLLGFSSKKAAAAAARRAAARAEKASASAAAKKVGGGGAEATAAEKAAEPAAAATKGETTTTAAETQAPAAVEIAPDAFADAAPEAAAAAEQPEAAASAPDVAPADHIEL